MSNKARLSVDLPIELNDRMNECFGKLRWKNAVFEALAYGLVDVLEPMTYRERKMFLSKLVRKRHLAEILSDEEEDDV